MNDFMKIWWGYIRIAAGILSLVALLFAAVAFCSSLGDIGIIVFSVVFLIGGITFCAYDDWKFEQEWKEKKKEFDKKWH